MIKTKHLHCVTIDYVTIETRCNYNLDTHYIGIYNGFQKSHGTNAGSKTNRTCPTFLGIHVAEQVLSKLFKNVQRMPNNNPGYDFICGKGFKVDVKSSCFRKDRPNTWTFKISKNTTTDFFLCLVFDNRIDLNPLHVWLIPGEIINHLNKTTISKSTLDKWSKYEKTLDKVLSCCNTMKEGK